ncbi:MAG: threonine--tRNA ligase [Alphaproteobacteria bacterium]|nr:threonine--tRNA ligase [Alphaproteobacteria bacterium]MBO4644039.1 threonine--tRNA ligase [Alphaproteobacteria bacterium]
MVSIRLPDSSQLSFDGQTSGAEIAARIGPGLAKAALAIKVNGKAQDLATPITQDADIDIITAKSPEGLDIIRHTCSHVMAEAVQELYPETQVTIGPSIENGFYYDFARKTPFTPTDLEAIEKKMAEIIDRDETIVREEKPRAEAIKFFKDKGEKYKVELIEDLPADAVISFYKQGNFIDLCRGPHLPSTGKVGKAFKLMKVAGAYWRGDSSREQLQRIYGTAWADKKALDAYLLQLEEAEKRDHRKLGREMDLFHFEDVAPGDIFWHPHGWTLFQTLIDYERKRQNAEGYVEINTPQIMDRVLWETSGHWDWYRENMFTTTIEDRVYCVKPMNCPGGILVFKQGIKSYRDLPQYIAEFGRVHRYEASGAIHGLFRVRGFTQDDAHIFCTPEQLEEECQKVVRLMLSIYEAFDLKDINIKLSTRPEKRIGSDELWDHTEAALAKALTDMGYKYTLNPGDGAFYGPKLDFKVKDTIGREWQLGTLQVDMNLPERFDVSYIGEDGEKHRPIMLHRALFGSLERFTGIMIENYAGKFPFWLAPVQAVVATITDEGNDYAREVLKALKKAGIRAELDLRNEKINYKIREHSLKKVPVMLVIGKKEAAEHTLTIRRLGQEKQETLALDDVIAKLVKEAALPLMEN